jgi:predicted PolB exonuclease-like 3'-5' exonuclease
MDRFPRHIAKIISLCVVYGIDFWQLMKAGGSQIDDSGKAPLFGSDFNDFRDFGLRMRGKNGTHG